ncbi:MAG: CHAT domain-containing protein [Candidatus Eisenbacteria bacterium]|uniref:CHAT domain-containing protein n=1 Tax=Eiseniibacteriota bacterium TaxID=2212470 RepID=A0A948W5E8_UNCEI|nr:CHAT domain-containing protein [Candidatus Eisenbacteria bacterium]MBU2693232.1 CHAT domain-containing protein [Candidatus Eisenbacteria bacterium]
MCGLGFKRRLTPGAGDSRHPRRFTGHLAARMVLSISSYGKQFLQCLLVGFCILGPDPCSAALSPADSAWALTARGRYEEAEVATKRILSQEADEPLAIYCLALALHELERDEEATDFFHQMAKGDGAPYIEELGTGCIELLGRQPATAESLLSNALLVYESRKDLMGELVLREQIGWACLRQEHWSDAESSFAAALKISDQLANALSTTHLHIGLGMTFKDRSRSGEGDYIEIAVEHLETAIRGAREHDLPQWEMEALFALSIIRRWQNNIDDCLNLRRAALEASERTQDLTWRIEGCQRVAAILLMRQELSEAAQLLHKARRMAREIDRPQEAGWVVLSLGHIAYLTGELERAREFFEESYRIGQTYSLMELSTASLTNLGVVLIDQERFEEAQHHFLQALDLCRQMHNKRGEVQILQNLGSCHYQRGDTDKALSHLEQASQIAGTIRGNVGVTQAYLTRDIGFCHLSKKNWEKAQEAFRQAVELGAEMGLGGFSEDIYWGLALATAAQGDSELALTFLADAMADRESLRERLAGSARVQSSFFGRKELYYHMAIDLLFELHQRNPEAGYDQKAFEIAQRTKSRSFLDMLAEAEVELRSRADPLYQDREAEILNRIEELFQQQLEATGSDSIRILADIASLEQELDFLEQELRMSDPRYAELQYPRPSTLKNLQEDILRKGELVLEYIMGDSAAYLWKITEDSFGFYKLPMGSELEESVRNIFPLLSDYNLLGPDPAYFASAAVKLSQILLSPVESDLDKATRVIIAPHGILYYLPFEIMPVRTGFNPADITEFGDFPYLVLTKDVIYTPSASALARLGDHGTVARPASEKGLLIIGDPILPKGDEMGIFARAVLGKEASPLPYAGEEIAGLESLFGNGQCRVLRGREAVSANLKQWGAEHDFRLLHLATHGIFNERRPRYSGLLLTPQVKMGDDGFLSVAEVFALDLPCDQVVLSACSSALGEQVSGEGLLGLTRAFLYSGARSVVAALWEVSGRATSIFMQDFYREISLSTQPDRAQALARAKRRMIRRGAGPDGLTYSHPFCWSAFILTGNPE